jgi:hypothetical protein
VEHIRREGTPKFLTSPSSRGAEGTIHSRERTSEQMGSRKSKQSLARRDSTSTAGKFSTGLQGDSEVRAEPVAIVQPAAIATIETDSTATEPISAKAGRLDSGSAEAIEPKRYTPPDCSVCSATRPKGSYTDVYCVRRMNGVMVRYCVCRWCGNRFKAS